MTVQELDDDIGIGRGVDVLADDAMAERYLAACMLDGVQGALAKLTFTATAEAEVRARWPRASMTVRPFCN